MEDEETGWIYEGGTKGYAGGLVALAGDGQDGGSVFKLPS